MTGRAAMALAAAAALALSAGVADARPTEAAWNRGAFHAAALTTLSVPQVTSLSCGATSGLLATAVPITWTTPRVAAGLAVPDSYRVSWTGQLGSGSKTVTGLTTTVDMNGTLGLLSPTTITIVPIYAGWTSLEAAPTVQVRALVVTLGIIVSWQCG